MAVALEVEGLCYAYDRGHGLLSEVELSVEEGTLACLLGPNGAGKTTLLKCIMGFITPTSGSVCIAGRNVKEMTTKVRARTVAYVPQTTTTFFPFRAVDIVLMGITPHLRLATMPSRRERAEAAAMLARLGAGELADRPFAQLSGGERQLVMIARALLQRASVMVVDEPTAALDYGNEVLVLNLLQELASGGCSILMTTHQPNHALWWGSYAALLHAGRILAAGDVATVMTADRLSTLYDVPIQLIETGTGVEGAQRTVCAPVLQVFHNDKHMEGQHDVRRSPTS